MARSPKGKDEIISSFAINSRDSGSAQVQIALITHRLKQLQDHFKAHEQDNHSRRGLFKLVGRRRRLLNYLKRRDVQEYRNLIQVLGIRK